MSNRRKLTRVEDHLRHHLKDAQFAESYAVELVKAHIAREVISVRVKKHWTQAQLAKRVGVSQQQISKIENGEFDSIETVMQVLFALGHRFALVLPPDEVPLETPYAASAR